MHILRKTVLFGAVVATMVLSGCNLDRTPRADFNFTMNPESGYPPLVVTFDGHASSSPNGIAAYEWDFGGGDTDVGPTVSRIFTEKGIYPVTLEITDSAGQRASCTKNVTARKQDPVARFTMSVAIASVNQPVRFDASASTDPDGEIVYYLWDFGDGEIGEGVIADHDYATGDGRRFVITLTVIDENEATHSFSREIQVIGSPCCGG